MLDTIKLYISTLYRDRIKRYLTQLDKEQQEKLIASIYIVLSLFTIAFFGAFAINPTLSTVSTLKKQYDDYKGLDDKMQSKIQSLSDLDRIYAQITTPLTKLDQAFPNYSEIPSFGRKVEIIAQQNKLNIVRYNTDSVELFPLENSLLPLIPINFNLTATGSKEDFAKFLSAIISIDRLLTINNVSIKSDEDKLTLSIRGKIYFKKI